jgi:site-specific DNA recombinase
MSQIDKQLDGLLNRIVETENPSVISAYEKKIAKLDSAKLLLADKLSQNGQPKHTLEEIFELSMRFLANPWNIWTNGNLTLKKIVLRMAFKAPLSYSRESGFRTPQTSVIFRFLDEISLKSKMVPPRRIELLLPKGNWILNPARLPVPPQGHSDLN